MSDGVLEEFQPIRLEGEKLTRDLAQHVCSPRPVKKIGAVILPA
jgi:hypothetical protein